MKSYIFLFILLGLLLTSCSSSIKATKSDCSGEFIDGICCSYVCEKECPSGFESGTCHCECIEQSSQGIEDAFDQDSSLKPPEIPI